MLVSAPFSQAFNICSFNFESRNITSAVKLQRNFFGKYTSVNSNIHVRIIL
jgi:hypothetical protein